LRFAIGCCWATRVIAFEHQPSRAAVSSTAVVSRGLIAYADQNFGFLSLRSSTFFLVLSLHVVLIYGFMTALSHTHKATVPDPLQNKALNNPPPRVLPVPVPDPLLKRLPIEVPKPDTEIKYQPNPDDVTVDTTRDDLPPIPLTPPTLDAAKRIEGGPGAGFPNPDEFYPEAARRLEEQGIATVQVCVDTKGHLTSDPTTLQSTGSPRLDGGALKLARAGSGHYRAATVDGQPVNSCYPLGIRFQLRN
jgi:TonB family protein